MYDRHDSAPSLLSFLIGGFVGASLTCLLAPQTGTALRQRIRGVVKRGARPLAAGDVPVRHVPKVPEPGLPADMGRGGRG